VRIALDVTQILKKEGRGIARYIHAVVPELVTLHPSSQWNLCIRGSRWSRRGLVNDWLPSVKRSWLPLSSWMTVGDADLFHSFGNHLPAISSAPKTFTVHDFRVLDRSQEEGATGARLRRNIARSDGILCHTEHGKSRLLKYFPKYAGVVSVAPLGVDHEHFRPQAPEAIETVRVKFGLKFPFLLQLGSWFPHKNLELSLRAFSQSRSLQEGMHLVFVGGGATAAYKKSLQDLSSALGLTESVHWIEDVSGKELPGILGASQGLLQPSHYEGFALPVLEAMATGIPGVLSNSSCLPEVSAGIWPALSVDDADGFALAMDAMSMDQALREKTVVDGLRHAASFTWQETARKTGGFFQDVLA
jgi:glycosyltransferase involved in cell wall biosynthesis